MLYSQIYQGDTLQPRQAIPEGNTMISGTMRFAAGCVIAAGGLLVTYKAGMDLYDKHQENKKIRAYKEALRVHNSYYEEEYKLTLNDYMERLAVPFRYVHRFPYLNCVKPDKYEILMSPFGMLINHDVALLLACAMARKQYQHDFPKVLGGGPLVWNSAQTRYVTQDKLDSGMRDLFQAEYTVDQYLDLCLHFRKQLKEHRGESIVLFVQKQSKIIRHLLNDDSFEPGEDML